MGSVVMRKLLVVVLLLTACQSAQANVPDFPDEPMSDIMSKCVGGLDDAGLAAFNTEGRSLGQNPSPRAYGELLHKYYKCDETEAFAVWWLGGTHRDPQLDRAHAWAEFSAGWEGK